VHQADVRPPRLRKSGSTTCEDLLVVETSNQGRARSICKITGRRLRPDFKSVARNSKIRG
jgi:hypothetical protein